ncbi:hypothetical protein TNCV_1381061 [Trichonephila clavipes]|nr:hypothetical protein TNCV_1381061 [Trichonephila clavipes]
MLEHASMAQNTLFPYSTSSRSCCFAKRPRVAEQCDVNIHSLTWSCCKEATVHEWSALLAHARWCTSAFFDCDATSTLHVPGGGLDAVDLLLGIHSRRT